METFHDVRERIKEQVRKDRENLLLEGTGWVRANWHWSEYPIGTKARESWSGGYWVKTERGWRWHTGTAYFPCPSTADEVMFPAGDPLI